ncbi:hypothetical protein REPUB_Repub20aG0102300 [Reevesia pubescens]
MGCSKIQQIKSRSPHYRSSSTFLDPNYMQIFPINHYNALPSTPSHTLVNLLVKALSYDPLQSKRYSWHWKGFGRVRMLKGLDEDSLEVFGRRESEGKHEARVANHEGKERQMAE